MGGVVLFSLRVVIEGINSNLFKKTLALIKHTAHVRFCVIRYCHFSILLDFGVTAELGSGLLVFPRPEFMDL